ncbi:hypothetical protein Halar_0647 (plasmid) [halophilic archaeon DL31]|jgi:hypothetical protein|nr:hypothetical protein Halar_0647 [halophilic archaeon DL31]
MISQRPVSGTKQGESGISEEPSSVTVRIVAAVADCEGVDPMALVTPLYEAIDPDALAAVTEADLETELTLSFNYAGYRVTVIVDDESIIEVTPQ